MFDVDTIRRAYVEAQAAWPGILVAQEAFEARMADSLARWKARDAGAAHKPKSDAALRVRTSDLYFAVALERGDQAAWERFYQDNFDFVRNVAGKFAASAEDAEELAQQFCSTIQERIRGYAGWCSLRGWLCTVLPNVVRDHYRRRSKEVSLDAIEEEAEEGERPTAQSDGGKGAEETRSRLDRSRCAEMLRMLLREALEALKPQWRDLMFYRYAKGLKSREIAEAIFRVKEDVVSKWIKKALAKLEKRILHLATIRYRSNRLEITYCLGLLRGEGFGGLGL